MGSYTTDREFLGFFETFTDKLQHDDDH